MKRYIITEEQIDHMRRTGYVETECDDIFCSLPGLPAPETGRLLAFVQELADESCEYGDNCPDFVKLNHGKCLSCRAREAITPRIHPSDVCKCKEDYGRRLNAVTYESWCLKCEKLIT